MGSVPLLSCCQVPFGLHSVQLKPSGYGTSLLDLVTASVTDSSVRVLHHQCLRRYTKKKNRGGRRAHSPDAPLAQSHIKVDGVPSVSLGKFDGNQDVPAGFHPAAAPSGSHSFRPRPIQLLSFLTVDLRAAVSRFVYFPPLFTCYSFWLQIMFPPRSLSLSLSRTNRS